MSLKILFFRLPRPWTVVVVRVVVGGALGEHDAARGQEVPDAVEPGLAVDVVEVVALAVAGLPGHGLQVAVEELLPGALVDDRRGREHAVQVEEDGGSASPALGAVAVAGVQKFSHAWCGVLSESGQQWLGTMQGRAAPIVGGRSSGCAAVSTGDRVREQRRSGSRAFKWLTGAGASKKRLLP